MATPPKKKPPKVGKHIQELPMHPRRYLFISEWIEARHSTFEKVAARLGVARETVWRWANEQHRLNPDKIGAIAIAIGIEPAQFYARPGRPSLDAIMQSVDDPTYDQAVEIVSTLARPFQ